MHSPLDTWSARLHDERMTTSSPAPPTAPASAARTLFSLPADLLTAGAGPSATSGAAGVVSYRTYTASDRVAVLVTQPTLVHVRRGTKILHHPGLPAPLTVRAGQLVLMPTGLRLMSELLAEARYESTVLCLDPAYLAQAAPELAVATTQAARPSVQGVQPALGCVLEPAPGLAARMDALAAAVEAGAAGSGAQARLHAVLVEEIALRLTQGTPACRALLAHGVREGQGTAAVRLRTVMAQHVLEPLRLVDFAALCGRSLASFKRDFQAAYGTAPGRWVRTARLEEAARLLGDPSARVTDVCFASGFSDLSSFSRAFRRAYHVSPKQWQAGRGGRRG